MLSACIMLYLIYKQTQKSQEWNRRKSSEDTLNRLVMGEFYTLLNTLIIEYSWDPVNESKDYFIIIKELEKKPEKLISLEVTLRSILRILETICINIKHSMIDEDICYDYLFSILINIHKKNHGFILKERATRNNPHVFEHLEYYAKRWESKNIKEDYIDNKSYIKNILKNKKNKL